MKIKELPKEFERKGVKYTQLVRNLYDVTNIDGEIKKEGYLIYKCEDIENEYSYYEVFRYRLTPQHPYSNEDYDMIESYPSDELFGTYAWCCSNTKSLARIMMDKFGVDYDVSNIC